MALEGSSLSNLQRDSLLIDEGGLLNLPWRADPQNPFALPELNVDWLVSQPLLPILVPLIPSQTLYLSMVSHGFEECLEVIEWVRGHQLHQVLDYDLWGFDASNAVHFIQPDKVKTWFRAWLEIGPEFAADRVFELEEDLVVTLFSSLFEIHPEEISKNSDSLSDDFFTTPDKRFHVRLRQADAEFWEICFQLIMAMYAKDVRAATQTFAYSAMLVRQEHLAAELNWRSGRLADQGFVDKETAMEILRPKNLVFIEKEIAKLAREFKSRPSQELLRIEKFAKTEVAYALDISPEIFDSVANILQEMDTREAARLIHSVLPQGDIKLLAGTSDPNDNDLVDDPEIIREAVERAVSQGKTVLGACIGINFRKEGFVNLLIERAFQLIAESSAKEDQTLLFLMKGKLAQLANAISAAVNTAESFSPEVIARSLEVVRGCINIGLELVLPKAQEFGIELDCQDFHESKAAQVLRVVGPEPLFHMGWARLKALSQTLADSIVDLYLTRPAEFSFLRPEKTVALHDGSCVKALIDQLTKSGRYGDVRRWLSDIESELDPQIFWNFNALLNKVPLFGECFVWNENSQTRVSISRELKVFSSLQEVLVAENFVSRLPKILDGKK